MRDEPAETPGGWIAGTRYHAELRVYAARPLPVCEPPGYTGEHVYVPGSAFTPPAAAPVRMERLDREVYALRETAQAASERLAEFYNAQRARQEGTAFVQITRQ